MSILPDQKGPHTPGMNSFSRETAIWQVEVPHTKTIREHKVSTSDSEKASS